MITSLWRFHRRLQANYDHHRPCFSTGKYHFTLTIITMALVNKFSGIDQVIYSRTKAVVAKPPTSVKN